VFYVRYNLKYDKANIFVLSNEQMHGNSILKIKTALLEIYTLKAHLN
jgi:hypothetical protein